MKKLIILWTIILLVLLPVALVISCQQQPAPAPPPAPSPPPAPPPAPSPPPAPTPLPAPPPPPLPPPAQETLTYANPWYGFSLEYPKDWDSAEGVMGTIVLFGGPLVEGEFMINVYIMSEELSEFPEVTRDNYCKMSEMRIKKGTENYKKEEEQSAIIAGLPAMLLKFSSGSGADMLMRTQAYFIKENVAYVITYTATPESYDEYADSFELVIKSFKFEFEPLIRKPEKKELLVQWVRAQYGGWNYEFEGSVKNVGTVPLNDIQVDMFCYDADWNLVAVESASLYPETIPVGEIAHFNFKFLQKKQLETYDYRFFTASDNETIPFQLEDQ